jgi:hypothetical protein
MTEDKKYYPHYLHVTDSFNLDWVCRGLYYAFGHPPYLVGSVLRKRDWRDVDLSLMLDDDVFQAMFEGNQLRLDVMNAAMSEWISKRTGLPIDFKFQDHTNANREHSGKGRNAMGISCMVEEGKIRDIEINGH